MRALILHRLQVYKSGRAVFDQPFSAGLNVLYGDNGSGKSTIADLIFFALGGDLREWKPHAAICDEVIAEVTVGKSRLTLKRSISQFNMQPMTIFFGPLAEAIVSAASGWSKFDYKRGERGHSFSQVLFEALSIPESPGEGGANITMHQMLRVMYSDQMTPIQRLFRSEHHDSWDTRQAVGDLVRAVGGYDLPDLRLKLRALEKVFSDINAEYRGLVQVATRYGEDIRPEYIETEIKRQLVERSRLISQLAQYESPEIDAKSESLAADLQRKKLAIELADAQNQINENDQRIRTIKYEIGDSDEFIQYLRDTLMAFEDAAATHSYLGRMKFEYCPACFTKLDSEKHKIGCHLCGEETTPEHKAAQVLALKLDFEHQIKESVALQADRIEALEKAETQARKLTRNYRRLGEQFGTYTRAPSSAREMAIAEINRKIGFIDSSLETLARRAEIARKIAELSDKKEEIQAAIGKLKDQISATEESQKARILIANASIGNWTLNFLKQDLAEHSDFERFDSFDFDFGDDWMALNGERNVSKSASGMVILKNSFHMALLLAAVGDEKFNLPHFMLFDNIEDKGMVPPRSWNFQNMMAKASAAIARPHQIIITTTMLSPDIAKLQGQYLIGKRKYTKEFKTLEFGQ